MPKNVVIILADDLGSWALGCNGNAEVKTPALDSLARSGCSSDTFFCASPVCSPARASIMTGMIPSRHGVHDWIRAGNSSVETERNGKIVDYLAGALLFTDVLADAGYECALSGKWHLGDSYTPRYGFKFWEVHAKGGGPYYGAPVIDGKDVIQEPRYITDAITDNALRYLEKKTSAAPFCLLVNYTAPHSPWNRENHPAELWDEYFHNCPFESVPQLPIHPWQINTAPVGYTPETRRRILSGYYSAITAMDRNIQRILNFVDSRYPDTAIIFTSDNGMNLGQHGIYGKGNGTFPQNMYDSSVMVPFLARFPGHTKPGSKLSGLYSHCDLFPTILEYCGIPASASQARPGKSFLKNLQDSNASGRDFITVCNEYGPVRMIRTERWKLVVRSPEGPDELYDMQNDPNECLNLHRLAEFEEIERELRNKLEYFFKEYSDPCFDGTAMPITGKGQYDIATTIDPKPFADDFYFFSSSLPELKEFVD